MKRRTFKQKGKGDLNQVAQTVGGDVFEIPTLRRADRSAIKRAELASKADRIKDYESKHNKLVFDYNSNIGSITSGIGKKLSLQRTISSTNIANLLRVVEEEGRQAREAEEKAQEEASEAEKAKIRAQEVLRRQKQQIEQAEEILESSDSNSLPGLPIEGFGGYRHNQKKKKKTQKKYKKTQKKYKKIRQV